MTETDDQQNGRQQGVGKTGGLPGHHADPQTRQPSADQLAESTVPAHDVSPAEKADQEAHRDGAG